MPFTALDYPILTPEQTNPLAGAISGLLKGIKEGPNFYKSAVEAKYAPLTAQTTADYKAAMAQYLRNPNQALKGLTPLGKSFLEPSVIKATLARQGTNISDQDAAQAANLYNSQQYNNSGTDESDQGSPNPSPAPNPPSSDAITNAYNLLRQKQTTDVQTRNRTLFATNIEKTINYIDPDALTQYGGFQGTLQKGAQSVKSAFGSESPDYDKYITSSNAVKLLTKQIRQFYGDSIQPQVQANLEILNNPATLSNNPKLAKEVLNQTLSILKNETQTYRSALKSTEPYQGEPENTNPQNTYANETSSDSEAADIANNGNSKYNTNKKTSSEAISNELKNSITPIYSEGKQPPKGTTWMKEPKGKIYAVHNERIEEVKKPPYNMKEVE
jgi:hypothetical protein